MPSTEQLKSALRERYLIEREIGAGGMATVYLAHDVRHDRRVALKVLRPELAAIVGAERFLQEIRTTANLQHPHILPLYDSGAVYRGIDGSTDRVIDAAPPDRSGDRSIPGSFELLYYVMPYVEGETLRDKLNREKQLGVEQAVEIACSVAAALDYAHRHGVIHRDIKPDNILLHDEQPLIADFGIALALSQAGGSRLTETGLSVGTPHYMSPEQAMGDRELDARSDVYSLAAMLYEMLAGDPPYTGSTAQAIVAKILTEKPPSLAAVRETVPRHVASATARALSKLPADRFPTASQFAEALMRPGSGDSYAWTQPRADAGRRTVLRRLVYAAAILTAGVLAGMYLRPSRHPAGAVVRAVLDLPRDASLDYPAIAFSHDGRRVVVAARQQGRLSLWQRRLDDLAFTPVPGTDGATRQYLSPDGEWVAFGGTGQMNKIPLAGGPSVALDGSDWGGGDWGNDGTVVYTQSYRSGLWRTSAEGGNAEMLTAPDSTRGELAHWWPQILPDGKHVIFTVMRSPLDSARIEVLSLDTKERQLLVTGGVTGRYVPPGYLLFARDEVLFAMPFDAKRLVVTGSAVPVVEDVAIVQQDALGAYAVSDDGTLVYVPASQYDADVTLVWVSRSGQQDGVIPEPGRFSDPALSPDGRWLALSISRPGEDRDVWVFDLARRTRSRLTVGGASDFAPRWTPSGDRVIYESERPVFDLYWRPADGSAPAESLVVSEYDKVPWSFTPDGRTLLFTHSTLPRAEIWSVPLGASGKATPLLSSEQGSLASPALSPDGRWLAYVSDESGRNEVYLLPYPALRGGRKQVSVNGGSAPKWTRGGSELVFVSRDTMMSVGVSRATGEPGSPDPLFGVSSFGPTYDVASDGQRFVMTRRSPDSTPRSLVVVTNFIDELRAKVGG